MNKSTIRLFVLRHSLTRELFFFFGGRKANLKRIDRAIAKGNLQLADDKAENVIVSLTSYGERIPELKYTLYSLVVQSIRPEKIIVNVGFEDEQYISNELKSFAKYGVEFFLCKNMRSHTKLLPTLSRFPNACVVTADDDIYYEKDWLKRLYEEHLRHPEDVCCHLIETVTYRAGQVESYKKWKPHYHYKAVGASRRHLLLGAWGVLYPPDSLYKDAQKAELFFKLCPLADDIWFYFMVVFNGKKIRQIQNPMTKQRFINPYREYGIIDGVTLTQQNVIGGKNDIQIRNILSHYEISDTKFIDFIEDKIDNCL